MGLLFLPKQQFDTNIEGAYTMINLLTIEEVAKILRVSKLTAYNFIHSDGFPKVLVGRAWRVEEQLLLKWIQEKSVA